ncbi:MAG: AAA family ATPase [Oscillospiraceae bacterium]|nr:AAA family ATPase [Oscillospiraceae bacterium]
MKVYSMTATFGKLEHQTLTLQPGLNIIEAPNEWGKSTWCAFLVNMLYGLDTRAKSTKTALADKDRYAPWSGSPMSGRIDLNWNGKDITIERQTRGRLIFGEFSAYETATGIPVEELNSTNCGQMLLGVERSVFTRAGFLKLTDLPVTQDDALRRRLNNLVTTGDESGAGDKLASTLKDLKNRCRYNRTGLLPQAEAQKQQLENQLSELSALRQETEKLRQQLAAKEVWLAQLENHKATLLFEASREDAQRVAQAEQACADAQAAYEGLKDSCEGLPSTELAQKALQEGKVLQQLQQSLQMEQHLLPPLPEQPPVPAHYQDIDTVAVAKADFDAQLQLETGRKKWNRSLWVFYALAVLLSAGVAVAGFVMHLPLLYAVAGVLLVATCGTLLAVSAAKANRFRREMDSIYDRHPGLSPDQWIGDAQDHVQKQAAYQQALQIAQATRADLDARSAQLQGQIHSFAGEEDLHSCLDRWAQNLAAQDALGNALRDWKQAQKHAEGLRAMLKPAQAPKEADTLTYSTADTNALLASAAFDLRQLQLKIGQYEGRAEALGQESSIRSQLKAVTRRIHLLEDTYGALELAQNALSAATTELQRRFAPRISKRAQALFGQLTGQRYDRLTLSSDLSLNTCTQEEATLRPAQYRSDGTVDQLYLALRLAVAEELTPDAPLVLDDALVRFDDTRLTAALDILREYADNKQVILFTCQGRESRS